MKMNLYLISVVVICSLDLVSSANSKIRTLHPKNINSLLLQTTSRFIDGIEESATETEQAAELANTDKKVDQKESVQQESAKKDDQAKEETQDAAPTAASPEPAAPATSGSQKLSQDKSEEQKAE